MISECGGNRRRFATSFGVDNHWRENYRKTTDLKGRETNIKILSARIAHDPEKAAIMSGQWNGVVEFPKPETSHARVGV